MPRLRPGDEAPPTARANAGDVVSAELLQDPLRSGALRGFGGFFRFALSAVLLIGLGVLVDWYSLGNAARSLSWSVLAICAAILLVQVLIGAWRANSFLRIAGSRPDTGFVVQAYALSVLANAFLLNFVAGAIARIVLLHRHQVSISVSVATIVAEKITILATLSGLAMIAAFVWFQMLDHEVPSFREAMLLIGAGIVVIVLMASTARTWSRLLLLLLRGWPRATVDQCLALLSAQTTWLVGAGATLLSLLCAWGTYTLLAGAMGIEDAGPMIALVLPLVSVIASLPISIGGWGVREVSFSALLYGFGVPAEKAILVTAIASLLGVVAAFVVAVAVFAGKRRAL
jgi:uncharacterized membrane protein YbhN (UPF0104 family)